MYNCPSSGIIVGEEALDVDFDGYEDFEHLDVKDPVVPFSCTLRKKLFLKTDILIKGVIPQHSFRFDVNFCFLNPDGTVGICFHLNPRFDQNYIARNSKIAGSWGVEEQQGNRRNPLSRGKPFIIEIFVAENCFMVAVDGLHFCEFQHRISIDKIISLEISGDVCLHHVYIGNSEVYPSTIVPYFDKRISVKHSPPLYMKLPCEVKPGMELTVKGIVKMLPHSWYLNLQSGSHYFPHPKIAFHFNVRIQEEQKLVVYNHWRRKTWEAEKSFPITGSFTPSSLFELSIKVLPSSFLVSVDGNQLPPYDFNLSQIKDTDTIFIYGDIFVLDISCISQ